jgi:hypothetical protein
MVEELYRYDQPITRQELSQLLVDHTVVGTVSLEVGADLKRLRRRIAEEISKRPRNRAQIDVALVEDVHQVFKNLPRQVLLDMRFWQWLTIEVFQNFVWERWFDGRPADIAQAVSTTSRALRFLGAPSLTGASRNALCRLYSAAERLYTPADGYKWCKSVFSQQDRQQSIFERKFGLYPPACLAVLKLTAGKSGTVTQAISKRLNHIATTLVIDAMTEREISDALHSSAAP